MTDTTVSFTPDELAQRNQGNVTAFILMSIAYQQAHGASVEEYVQFVGQKFTPSWEQFKDHPLHEIGRQVALNFVAASATLRQFTADENRVEFALVGWPTDEDLTFFGVSRTSVAPFFNVFAPIAEQVGLHYAWHHDGDQITMTFTRPQS